jgi:poly(A) polymerase
MDAIDDVFHARIGDVSGGGKLAGDMREIWVMQPRFEKRVGSTPFGMVDQPRFRAAFDFMRLRADIGEVDEMLADWWQEFSMADDTLRQDLVDQVREEQHKRQRAPRVARAPRAEAPGADGTAPVTAPDAPRAHEAQDSASVPGEGDAGAPRKRRRRRRSGAAKGAAGNADGAGESGS